MNSSQVKIKTIFISYAREDATLAHVLYGQLVDAGFEPWMDEMHLPPGSLWEQLIREAITKSNIFLACLTHSSVQKVCSFVQEEWRFAREYETQNSQIKILPAR
ncbi:MAG TPA: toll/interleukin-1 receptor domain-containing protein, partial [Saprospiraceae bacterium]|nr:toll/interleukin-1 receptor domain-containing protein [Saprospiraceae bacterium]